MKKKLRNPNPGLARLGKPLPELTCTSCGETKKASRFNKRHGVTYEKLKATDPRRYQRQCKRCAKPALPGQSREDVTEPKMVAMARKKKKEPKPPKLVPAEYKKKVRRETRVKSMIYLAEKGCKECGERDPRKLEYDHKDPADKKRIIARLIVNGYSWSSPVLRREIRKCRILCANCHRKHTIEQQGYYASEDVQDALRSLAKRYRFKV